MQELAEAIGTDAVYRLCDALGGSKVYVPAAIGSNHVIAAAIGVEAAATLAEFYHGAWLDLPKPNKRRQRAIELLEQDKLTVREVALQTDYTERQIYVFRSRMGRKGPPPSKRAPRAPR